MMTINKIIDRIENLAVDLSCIAMFAIMCLTTFDIIARKTIGIFIPSLYELTEEYFMVILIFLSMSYIYKIGGNVRVTLIVNHISPRIMTKVNQVLKVLYLAFFIIMFIQGLLTALEVLKFKEVSSSILGYPLAPAMFMVPIGALLVCVRIVQTIISTESK